MSAPDEGVEAESAPPQRRSARRSLDIDALWALFVDTRDEGSRNRLIVHFSPLVKYVAGRVGSGLPRSVDVSDLTGYGMFGLIDAVDKFDPSRGFKFETYAIPRIRGAILDGLRAYDWIPRSVRAKARAIQSAFSELEGELGRSPTDEELRTKLEWTESALAAALQQISSAGLVSLDEILQPDAAVSPSATVDEESNPGALIEAASTRDVLRSELLSMGERDRKVLTLYYYEGLTLAAIGKILDVTESRVCQIHARAVLQLRSRMVASDVGP